MNLMDDGGENKRGRILEGGGRVKCVKVDEQEFVSPLPTLLIAKWPWWTNGPRILVPLPSGEGREGKVWTRDPEMRSQISGSQEMNSQHRGRER
jgi:hypothetical protein